MGHEGETDGGGVECMKPSKSGQSGFDASAKTHQNPDANEKQGVNRHRPARVGAHLVKEITFLVFAAGFPA